MRVRCCAIRSNEAVRGTHSDRPYDPALRNILDISDLDSVYASIKKLENLRRKYAAEGDKEGLRLLREKSQEGRTKALSLAKSKTLESVERRKYAEIAEWLTLWMQSPDMFEAWST